MMRRTPDVVRIHPEDQHVTLLAIANEYRFMQIDHRRRILHSGHLLFHSDHVVYSQIICGAGAVARICRAGIFGPDEIGANILDFIQNVLFSSQRDGDDQHQ